MSIALHLDHYLTVRRSLGYNLRTAERVLRRFARFADQEGVPYIDTALFLRWDASLPDAGTSTRSARLGMVRLFAQWLSGIDPAHEVPPRGLLPGRLHRSRPYIYRDAEIALIIAAAKELPSIYGLRGLTCSTLFGLIASPACASARPLPSTATTSTPRTACCVCDEESSARNGYSRSTRRWWRSLSAMKPSVTGCLALPRRRCSSPPAEKG